MHVDERFIKGLELFNEGEYFECHEVIEELWLETSPDDPYRNLYKGVIQAAAAIYQFQREIYSGALGLFRSSVRYLDRYEAISLGLNVKQLSVEMRAFFADLDKNYGKQATFVFPQALLPVLEFSR